jgi:hypothetical protein
MRDKSVQIPQALFTDLLRFHLLGQQDEDTERRIRRALEEKIDAITRHDLYSRYKTAPTASQREAARQEYLEKAGIPEGFRWGKEEK